MLIHVKYTDNRFDYVKPFQLDELLEQNKLQQFHRSTGWVTVGIDPIRLSRRIKTGVFHRI